MYLKQKNPFRFSCSKCKVKSAVTAPLWTVIIISGCLLILLTIVMLTVDLSDSYDFDIYRPFSTSTITFLHVLLLLGMSVVFEMGAYMYIARLGTLTIIETTKHDKPPAENLFTAKLPIGFWIRTSTVLFIASFFLFSEWDDWKRQSEFRGFKEGLLAAPYDIQNERIQYLVLDPIGKIEDIDFADESDFTGELEDGVEIWKHGYAGPFFLTTPRRVHAEAYVSAYNDQIRMHVQRMTRLDKLPSAVERRSAELRGDGRRVRAAKLLGMMGTQAREAIPSLIAATSDESAELRAEAAWALGKIGPGDYREEVIAALELVLEIPNSTMQEIASRALDEINARTDLEHFN